MQLWMVNYTPNLKYTLPECCLRYLIQIDPRPSHSNSTYRTLTVKTLTKDSTSASANQATMNYLRSQILPSRLCLVNWASKMYHRSCSSWCKERFLDFLQTKRMIFTTAWKLWEVSSTHLSLWRILVVLLFYTRLKFLSLKVAKVNLPCLPSLEYLPSSLIKQLFQEIHT